MTMRIAIVGAGTIGQVHAKAAHTVGVALGTVVDADASRAKSLADEYVGAKYTTDLQVAFEDPAIDAVVVAAPNRWHSEVSIAAMRAGKDVLVEKPMGFNEAECRAMNEVAQSMGRILQVGMANRWTGVGQAAKRLIDSGELGKITHTKAILYRRRGVPGLGGWFTTKSISGGGVLADNGVHLIDLALWLLGFPAIATASGQVYSQFGKRMENYVYESMWAGPPKFDGICDVEDAAHAFLRFADGSTLDLNVTWAMNIPTKLESSMIGLFGEQGGVTFELYGDHLDLAVERERKNVDLRIDVEPVDNFQLQMASFAKCVAKRDTPVANGSQGQVVQSILDAIYRSSETGREVVF